MTEEKISCDKAMFEYKVKDLKFSEAFILDAIREEANKGIGSVNTPTIIRKAALLQAIQESLMDIGLVFGYTVVEAIKCPKEWDAGGKVFKLKEVVE